MLSSSRPLGVVQWVVGVDGAPEALAAVSARSEWRRCCPLFLFSVSAGWYPSQAWEQYSIVMLNLK